MSIRDDPRAHTETNDRDLSTGVQLDRGTGHGDVGGGREVRLWSLPSGLYSSKVWWADRPPVRAGLPSRAHDEIDLAVARL